MESFEGAKANKRKGCAIDIKGLLPFDPSGVAAGSTCYTF